MTWTEQDKERYRKEKQMSSAITGARNLASSAEDRIGLVSRLTMAINTVDSEAVFDNEEVVRSDLEQARQVLDSAKRHVDHALEAMDGLE